MNGILDLRDSSERKGWNFDKDGILALDGEWEFYWEKFIEPGFSPSGAVYMKVPSQWQKHGYPVDGFASYRLKILLPENSHPLQLDLTDCGTSYSLFINGKFVTSNGYAGRTREETVPGMQYKKVPANTSSSEMELIFYISNFHYAKAGFWSSMSIGSPDQVKKREKIKFSVDLIVFSSLAIMGIYHLGIFLNRRKDRSPLYFGIFCLFISLRTVSTGERIIMDVLPFIPFTAVHKIEFFTFYCGGIVFASFVKSLYNDEFSMKIYLFFIVIVIPASFCAVLFPMRVYVHLLTMVQSVNVFGILYVFYLLIATAVKKRQGAKLFLAGWVLFGSSVMLDILKSMGYLFTPDMASYGLLCFVIFQASVLSRRFSSAFSESERLTEELRLLSSGLEDTVRKRTKDLEQANQELEKLAESRKRLSTVGEMASGIVHDIKNPMTAIKAFADLAADSSVSEQDRKEYLAYIRREIDRLNDMAFEILDFSKGKITLNMESHNVKEFMNELYEFLRYDFKYLGIPFKLDCSYSGNLRFDRDRFRRVLINMANNAREAMQDVKPHYSLSLSADEDGEYIRFTVSDTGPGIPESLKGRLFETFATEGKKKGTGLGLFTSRTIVDQHGGKISWMSEADKGTEFRIFILR